jgi:hypothetical protein
LDFFITDLRPSLMMPLDEVTEETEQAEAESAEIGRMCQKLSSGLAILSSQDKKQSFVNGDHKVLPLTF